MAPLLDKEVKKTQSSRPNGLREKRGFEYVFKRSSGERLTRDEKGKTIEPLTLTLETERDILDTHICI